VLAVSGHVVSLMTAENSAVVGPFDDTLLARPMGAVGLLPSSRKVPGMLFWLA
jgi:hypothetical protein